ncbi:hypothetical protein [Pseudomonas phage COT4]|uniref:Uncharacterized protein n=1 Tax=Pseudomonas phage M5.1 TaxID=2873460 RepID=A0AAE8XDY5_9CAUD|nr:hypothetical protein QGX13_gp026 [Pseudomonas phage M5.1]UAV89627.1 hypothetical protein M51_26 [Pseudomonas phage M5.1]UGL61226.1 hypothetical protein [Pseudomonas phage COT4]
MLTKRYTNHIGHFILSILFFPWVLAWIAFYLANQRHNDEVDRMMWMAAQKG